MKSELNVGVIGCGRMGIEHVENLLLSGYCRPQNVRVSDVNPASLRSVQERFGVGIVPDSEALYNDPDLDAIIIACSNRYHAATAIRALESGKHVLLEKPMALNEQDARAVVKAAASSGKILHVGFELRNSAFPRMVRNMSAEMGPLVSGQVIEYRGHFWPEWKGKTSDGGSMFLMETCHLIDLFRWLTESEVTEIHAVGSRTNIVPHYEYPDTQFTSLVFESGFVGHISLCHVRSAMPEGFSYSDPNGNDQLLDVSLGHQYEYSLVGERGALRYLPLSGVCYFYRHEVQADGAVWQRIEEIPRCFQLADHKEAIHNVQAEMDEFLEAVASGGKGSLDPEDALRTHLVCFAAEEALRRRRPVALAGSEWRADDRKAVPSAKPAKEPLPAGNW